MSSRPEGAHVEKGELVCELDPTELQDRLAAQATLIRAREAELHAARLASQGRRPRRHRVRARGSISRDLQESERAIKLAESKLASAEDKVDWRRRMFDKGYASLFEKNCRRAGPQGIEVRCSS